MTSPRSKIKGTGGERQLRAILEDLFHRRFRKTGAGEPWDLETADGEDDDPIRVVATRPDRGFWLVTMRPVDWYRNHEEHQIQVEVKRWARFAHHTIYEETFR